MCSVCRKCVQEFRRNTIHFLCFWRNLHIHSKLILCVGTRQDNSLGRQVTSYQFSLLFLNPTFWFRPNRMSLYRKEYFHSPTCGTSTILVHLPCTKLSWSTPIVSQAQPFPSWLHWIPLLQENLLYPQYYYHTQRLDGTVPRHITKTH